MEPNYKILGICNQDCTSHFLGKVVTCTNFNMKVVHSCSDALQRVRAFLPHIILCDFSILSKNASEFMAKIREIIPQVIFIMVLPENKKETIYKAMSYGINNYVTFPLNEPELLSCLKQYEYLLKVRKQEFNKNIPLTPKQFSKTIGNNLEKVSEIVDTLISNVHPALTWCKKDLQLGLEELIINAIEHGNLAISYEEKSIALQDGSFEKLVEKKFENESLKNRKVSIEFHQDQLFDEWTIHDEGNGFNPCKMGSFAHNSEGVNGRGIMLCRYIFDEIEYFNEGKSVRVRRYVPKNVHA